MKGLTIVKISETMNWRKLGKVVPCIPDIVKRAFGEAGPHCQLKTTTAIKAAIVERLVKN